MTRRINKILNLKMNKYLGDERERDNNESGSRVVLSRTEPLNIKLQ